MSKYFKAKKAQTWQDITMLRDLAASSSKQNRVLQKGSLTKSRSSTRKRIGKTKKVFALSPLRAQFKLNHIANCSKCYKLAVVHRSSNENRRFKFKIWSKTQVSSNQTNSFTWPSQRPTLKNIQSEILAACRPHFGNVSAAFQLQPQKLWHQSGLQTNSKQFNNMANSLASHSTS